jgi:predicted dehydrogenase
MKKLKIGLIGCGYWGRNYLRIINQCNDVDLVSIADKDISRLDGLAETYPDVKLSINSNDVISDWDIDAVVVCTSVSSHYALVSLALHAGKHVLCEKPLALTVAECDKLASISRSVEKVLLIGHVFEYNSVVRYMIDAIRERNIGALHYISFLRTGLGPIREDVNVVYDLASHDVSIALSLSGAKPIAVTAFGSCIIKEGREDVAFIVLEFEGRLKVQISCSWIDPMKQRQVKVVGSKKMMLFDDVSATEKLRVIDTGKEYQNNSGDFGSFQLSVKDGAITIPNIPYPEPLQTEFRHFIDCISGIARPLTGVEYATDTVRVLEAVQKSLKNNSTRIIL